MNLHDNLHLCTLNEDAHSRTCGYWYLIRKGGCTPHTAFANRTHLLRWLEERGLSLTEEMPAHGESSWQSIKGTYKSEMHGSYDKFFALRGYRTRELSNGQYTLAIITTDEDGVRTVHTLNPNCRDRPVFDYFESRALFG